MKRLVGIVVALAVVFALLRRFGPALSDRAMTKCQEMMATCQEMMARRQGDAEAEPSEPDDVAAPAAA